MNISMPALDAADTEMLVWRSDSQSNRRYTISAGLFHFFRKKFFIDSPSKHSITCLFIGLPCLGKMIVAA